MILRAFDAIVAAGAAPEHAPRVAALRRAFEAATGAFGPEDPWFEVRSRAFWDFAVTRGEFAADVARAASVTGGDAVLTPEMAALVPRFARAHRGLFVVARGDADAPGGDLVVRDLWSGAAFVVGDVDPGTRDALAAAVAPFDGHLVGAFSAPATASAASAPAPAPAPSIALLPGALFHPEEAAAPIARIVDAARARPLAGTAVLDALLAMELRFRSLSRVKAAYAYRPEALPAPAASAVRN